ncbi:Fe-S protein [Stutzerimonas stutzeri TS44]|nr:Fe-S protein [Stutzerimonas stutzeri TS44]
MSDSAKPVASPCVSLCALDEDDVCVGCQRSVDEIRRWGLMNNDERRQVLRQCAERARANGQLM